MFKAHNIGPGRAQLHRKAPALDGHIKLADAVLVRAELAVLVRLRRCKRRCDQCGQGGDPECLHCASFRIDSDVFNRGTVTMI